MPPLGYDHWNEVVVVDYTTRTLDPSKSPARLRHYYVVEAHPTSVRLTQVADPWTRLQWYEDVGRESLWRIRPASPSGRRGCALTLHHPEHGSKCVSEHLPEAFQPTLVVGEQNHRAYDVVVLAGSLRDEPDLRAQFGVVWDSARAAFVVGRGLRFRDRLDALESSGWDLHPDVVRGVTDGTGGEDRVFLFIPALQRLSELNSTAEKLRLMGAWTTSMAMRDQIYDNDSQNFMAMLELYFWSYVSATGVDCPGLREKLDDVLSSFCSDDDTAYVMYDAVVQSFCPGVRAASCAFAKGPRPFGEPDIP